MKRAALLLSAALCAGSNAHAAPAGYVPDRPAAAVAIVETLRLQPSNLELKVYYPQSPQGELPVIVWSHGAGGSKDTYGPILKIWASYGYICIAPSHRDSIALKTELGEPVPQDLRQIVYDAAHNVAEWRERPQQISFIIDQLPKFGDLIPVLRDRVDSNRVGVGGHSFGAYTTELIGGATFRTPSDSAPETFRDKRVSALLMISPQGSGLMGLSQHSWDAFTNPAMIVTGTNDHVQNGETPLSRKEPFDRAPAGNKYFVMIDGANHFSFAAKVQTPILSDVETVTLAFWDDYLRGDARAKEFLSHPELEGLSPSITLEMR